MRIIRRKTVNGKKYQLKALDVKDCIKIGINANYIIFDNYGFVEYSSDDFEEAIEYINKL